MLMQMERSRDLMGSASSAKRDQRLLARRGGHEQILTLRLVK
jgi:hypothetical protein